MQAGIDGALTGGPSVFDLPKLVPTRSGDAARIWVPDPNSISMTYVHSIGGKQAQQPGMPEPPFGGNWLCTGDFAVLKDSNPHSDPANCYQCREHKAGNPLVSKAKRKFIVQVFRYATDPSLQQPQVPFQLSLLVWAFSDKQYRALHTLQGQWGPVQNYDLLLQSDQQEFAFKQWTVTNLPDVMLMRDPSYQQLMQEIWANQATPTSELERILGRQPSNDQEIQQKLAEYQQAPAGQQYAQAPMVAPGFAPAMPPPAVPGQPYAPPADAVYPSAGPFDQPAQYAPAPAPQLGAPPAMAAPGMVPPPMPPTPAPQQQAAPPLPQAPPAAAPPAQYAPPAPQAPPAQYAPGIQPGQQVQPPAQYAPPPVQQPAAPQVPQAAPQMAPPQLPPAAPAAPQAAPQVPQPAPQAPPAAPAAPQVPQPGVAPQPGAPAAPDAVDYAGMLQAPPPPPPA